MENNACERLFPHAPPPCINIQKWAYKYTVELSLSKSATFSLQKFPFQLLKVPLLECKSGTFGRHFASY